MEVQCTIEESIAMLEHSQLATIVVEGSDDMTWYRWIEGVINPEVSILPVGGRDAVLSIFKARDRFKIPIAFVADRDLWLFSSVPDEYCDDLILTSGFSIENDILEGSVIERLFTDDEKRILNKCFSELSYWYVSEIESYLNGKEYKIDCKPGMLLDLETFTLKPDIRSKSYISPKNRGLYEDVVNNFTLKFRGKNLLNLYAYFLQHRQNKGDPTYRKDSLIEMSAKISCSSSAQYLVEQVKRTLSLTGLSLKDVD